jgi:outer membrane protein assembly factor BamE (lipoprotein component of BamABCDE complex)
VQFATESLPTVIHSGLPWRGDWASFGFYFLTMNTINQKIHQTILLSMCLVMGGCMTAAQHQRQLGGAEERNLTLGLVQKEIKAGLSKAAVAVALGSPNMVTGDSGNETWIYDKVASEASFSQDTGNASGNISGLISGSTGYTSRGSLNGDFGGGYSKSAGAASLTQHTLTVVIRFGSNNRVESVAYNSTRF